MKVRKQENVDAFKERILETAKAILVEEGIDRLSIRKITQRLEYTPGILYHYFKNKDEIIAEIVKAGYQDILMILRGQELGERCPSMQLKARLKAYMEGMLERREIFMLLMHSEQDIITSQVYLLRQGIRKERASMQMLCEGIEAGIRCGEFACTNVEARAQVIWCATFGVMERICQERVDSTMQELLIEEHLQMVVSSLMVKL